MAYSSAHNNIDWHNKSEDLSTPLGKSNLSKINTELKIHDERILELDLTRLTGEDIASAVKGISLDKTTGIITITHWDNTTESIDTLLEKIAVNFTFDEDTQELKITLDDGTVKSISLASFIHETDYVDSDTIAPTVSNHTVKMELKEHSIDDKHLKTDYLAQIKSSQAKSEAARDAAILAKNESEASAAASTSGARLAESWAQGGTGAREDEDVNNAKYWAEQAQDIAGGDFVTKAEFQAVSIEIKQLISVTDEMLVVNVSDPATTRYIFDGGDSNG